MIVYTSAFLLSQAATATPLTHARIGYQTWLRDLDPASIVASSADDDFPADAPLRPDTAEAWSPTALPATWKAPLGTTRAINYFGLVGNLGSAGCVAKWEWSTNDADWTEFATEKSPSDDAPMMWIDDEVEAGYVRLTVTGGSTMPRIAAIYAGQILAMARPVYGGITPPPLGRQTELVGSVSRGGQILGHGYRSHGVEGAVPFRHLTASWYRANFDPFVKAARRFPFFLAWRPADYPLEVIYGRAPQDIRPVNMGLRDFLQVDIPFVGIGYE